MAAARTNSVLKADPIHVSGVIGVRATLRWAGRPVGQADALDPPGDAVGRIDLAEAVATATLRALKAVELWLQRPAGAAPKRAAGAAGQTGLDQVAGRLRLDLQVAHSPQAIRLGSDNAAGELSKAFAPGFHGLEARRRDGELRWRSMVWPATALALNLRPQGQIRHLLKGVHLRHDALDAKANPEGLSWQRFEVIHVVRPAADLPVAHLVRGNRPLPPRPFTEHDLEGAAGLMARHLVGRQNSDGSFAGTFLPTTFSFQTTRASTAESALTAYALAMRHRLQLDTGGLDAAAVDTSNDTALRRCIRRTAERIAVDQTDPPDARASALLVLTVIESPILADMKHHRDAHANWLVSRARPDGSFASSDAASAPPLAPAAHALVSAALASLHAQTRDGQLLPVLHAARGWFWRGTPPQRLASTLPWSHLAESRTAQTTGSGGSEQDKYAHTAAARLSTLLKRITNAQVMKPPLLGPPDIVGGFDPAGAGGSHPAPDGRSGPLLAFLAAAVQDPSLSSAPNRASDLIACRLAARFLAQLMYDEPACYYALDRRDMVGGVRPALWDNRLPLETTAMALLALTQVQQSMETFADRTSNIEH